MPNSLINEDSPYLQQHANNPVDWFAWSDEAFEKAIIEQKPIFLSIGYSSCHWCHVMEEEVFENQLIADILNKDFICIKVDKEERPDIDKYYQNLFQIINKRGGGWPLSMFLTHEKKPFYAATYIAPRNFEQLSREIVELYFSDFQGVDMRSTQLQNLANMNYANTKTVKFEKNFLDFVQNKIQKDFDSRYGGFGFAPKFPHCGTLNLAMLVYKLTKSPKMFEIVSKSLKEMSKGGLRDIVDGGFCRYSTDDIWLVPHFEKMTYDNGLICESLLKCYEISKDEFFLKTAQETADFMLEKMFENGLFYSASDADSFDQFGKKREGEYFVYEYDELFCELEKVFGKQRTLELFKILDVTKNGNFEGKNILRNETFMPLSSELKTILKRIRSKKSYPFVDKKCITSWNAMMIKSLFMLSNYLPQYLKIAIDSIDYLMSKISNNDGLFHSFLIGGKEPSIDGFLEDYAYICDVLFEAYEVTFEEKYLNECLKLAEIAIAKFYKNGSWRFSVGEFETDVDLFDSSYPSSVALMNKIIYILGVAKEPKFLEIALESVDFYSNFLASNPHYSPIFSEIILMDLHEIKIFKANISTLNELKNAHNANLNPFCFYLKTQSQKVQICTKNGCLSDSII